MRPGQTRHHQPRTRGGATQDCPVIAREQTDQRTVPSGLQGEGRSRGWTSRRSELLGIRNLDHVLSTSGTVGESLL